ncbi:hypothetical protein BD311DRAFT_764249 [Dichomitus squalens]|uniref:Uncharacterized protein n=1 Tax=Dichomitus squalens TaxID=114155 RepID=A0A4Q9ME68_9APHY|nr:hypothetical protein BD311DRAFT_764249 [Dichomitus squalens]
MRCHSCAYASQTGGRTIHFNKAGILISLLPSVICARLWAMNVSACPSTMVTLRSCIPAPTSYGVA